MKNILYTVIFSFLFSSLCLADVQTIMDAAERGDPKAQSELGYMHVMGEGVLQDYEEAIKWFRLAAEQGLAKAQTSLGKMYYEGLAVLQDYEEAIKWYKLAAEQGYARAQYNLALCYGQGLGVDYDLVAAYMWFNISTVSGLKTDQKNSSEVIKQFKDSRDFYANLMTSEQIAKAQKLARECIKKNYKNCG